MSLTKALAVANRVRLVPVLHQGELCACQLTELFGLAPSTMSKHLSILYGKPDSKTMTQFATVVARPPVPKASLRRYVSVTR